MIIFTPIAFNWKWRRVKTFGLVLTLILSAFHLGLAQTTFNQSNLNFNGSSLELGTSLEFGPDGRLYATELYGTIRILTISKDGPNAYSVIDEEVITDIVNIPNHNDNGSSASRNQRETTGIVLGGTAANPVIYVTSSDPWTGGPGGDVDIDTNSGIITRLSWNGSSWDIVDLVRGLPRSEENHASNGMEIVTKGGVRYIILCQGGHTNAGAPSQNFAWGTEYALAAAILAINLDAIEGMPTKTDPSSGRAYKYDLPTLDDPTRPNVNGITDPNQSGYTGVDVGDPFGGNDGLNQAKLVPGGPVQIFSPGYRNSYDLVVTESGAVFVTDNGANSGWGGYPENEGLGGNATNNYRVGEPGSQSPDNGEPAINNEDHLTLITNNINTYTFGSFYGGHPNPVRSNPAGAGLFTRGPHSSDPGDSNGNSYTDDWFRTTILSVTNPNFSTQSLPVDWPPVPVSAANPIEGDFRLPGGTNPDGPNDVLVTTLLNNSNGIDEYTASGDMKGSLIIGRNNGSLHRIVVDANGGLVSKEQGWITGLGNDANALGITCNGDNDPFPGTIWVATFNGNIVVLEPSTAPTECILPGEVGYDPQADNDFDGYSNEDEDLNGTDLCSANSKPTDFDNDKLSDLIDLDDDNDGLNDQVDPFQLGSPFSIPVTNELFNNQGSLGGYKGLGLTGLMNNGAANPNYINWLDDPDASETDIDDILGGAVGAVTIFQTSGNALTNNQEKGFQYGVNVNSTTGNFIVSSRMLLPFHSFGAGESQGIFIGTGFQNNYLKIVLTAAGLEVGGENNDVAITGLPSAAIGIPSSNVDLFFIIDPALGTVQAAYSLDGGATVVNIGNPYTATGALLNALQDSNTPLAVGLIGTSGSNPEFAATWDFLNVNKINDVEEGQVVFRVNAGGQTLAAIDGGQDWVTDIDATLAANGFEVNTGNTFFGPPAAWNPAVGSTIQSATPFEIFQWERWDPDDPEPEINMTYTFNVGDPGDYKIRLFFRDTYSGTAQAGQRVFSIGVEGVIPPALTNIDISANPGPNLGTYIEVEANTTDNLLEIEFFRNIQSPFISGIEIIKAGAGTGVPIVVQFIPNQSNLEGDDANITVVASGGDGNLSFSASGLPPGVSIDQTNGLIGGTIDAGAATGSPYTVVVTVDDVDEFNSDAKSVSFTWTVTAEEGIPDTWTNITNVTEHIPRHENSMVQVGDKFYLFGGREDPQVVEAYDYTTNTWSTVSTGPQEFNHFQATAYEGMIWIIGSFDTNVYPVEEPEEFIWIFDPANNEWIEGPSIPAARRRGSTGLVVYNNKFYVVGGNTIGHDGGYVSWFDEYDPTTNTWTTLADAPRARDHFHATVINDKLYLAGGRQSGGPEGTFDPRLPEVDVYDFATQTWSTLPSTSNLPTPRGGTTTVTFNGEVVVIGGEGDGQAFNTTEALNPATGNWRALAPMNHARHGTQAIVSGDGIHISSGSPTQGGGNQNNMEVYGIDNPTGVALVASTLNVPATASVAANSTQAITISNTGGNLGVFITSITLGGANGTDFQITDGYPGPFLIKAGASHQIQLTNNGNTNQNPATLTINYGNASSKTVNLNTVGNTAPVAAFTATPTSGSAPLAVAFDASGSSDADVSDVLTYSWDFGDGNNGTGVNPSHTYLSDGTYTATLTVSDGDLSSTATVNIVVGTITPGQVVFRVNAGGATVPTIDGGQDWVSDIGATIAANGFEVNPENNTAYGPPAAWDPAISGDILSSTPFDIFDWERWDEDDNEPEINMTYTFNVVNPGDYKVRLFFRDTYSGTAQPGQRLFSITVDGASYPELTNIDISANPGPNLAAMIEVDANTTDNLLVIEFTRNVQSPFISGIEILKSGTAENPIVVQSVSDQTNEEGEIINLGIIASGGDGALSYQATGLPTGLGINPTSGAITGTIEAGAAANSPYSVQITVDDTDAENTDAQTISFTWNVNVPTTNTAPVASFIATPTTGAAPLLVNFDASASSDVDEGDILTYSWSYDDNSLGGGVITDHTFLNEGVYEVTLTVSDGDLSSTATATITVGPANTAPVASFIATPTSGDAPLLVSFDASASSDADVDDVLTYSWAFGNGDTGSGVTTSYSYLSEGAYTVTLTVSDGSLSSTATTIISVNNTAPIASFIATPTSGNAPLAVAFDASGSSDADANDILTYSWDFGDGNNGTGVNPSHTYLSDGSYTVTLTVSDGDLSSTSTTTITVNNTAPVAAFTATPTSGSAPLAVAFDASGSSDADVSDVLTYSWDFGDGNNGTGVNPSHTYLSDGTYTATLTVSDGDLSSTATVNIVVGTVTPGQVVFRVNAGGATVPTIDGGQDWVSDIGATIAANGFEVNPENNTAYGPPAAWDPAISGDILSSTPFDIFDWERWDADDPEPEINMTYTFNVVNPGDYKVRLFFRDTYSGTAQPGQRLFSITVDGASYPELTNIDISANPGPNLAAMIEVDANTTDNLLVIEFTRNVQSPFISGIEILKSGTAENPIVVQSVSDQTNEEGEIINLGIIASGGDGALSYQATGLPTGLGINSTSGAITGTIEAGAAANSPYSVQITVDDADAENTDAQTISFTWNVNVPTTNTAPVASFIATPSSGDAPLLVSFDASASSDVDVDDILTYSWAFGNGDTGSGVTTSYSYLSEGTYTVTLTVSDGELSSTATTTITVGPANTAPVASFLADPLSGDAPLLVSFDASASSDVDVDDVLTYSWAFGNGDTGSGVTTSYSYLSEGTYTVTLTVSDGELSSTATTTITVGPANTAPVASFIANPVSGNAPLLVSFDASASSDVDVDDVLTYSWAFGNGETGSGVTTSYSYLSEGTYTVTLTVSDGELSSTATTTITVNNSNQAPTASFTTNIISGFAPLTVAFDATISSDPDEDLLTFVWDFGDGNQGTGALISHLFETPGFYTVTLTVSDGQASDQTTIGIRVDNPNLAPLIAFTANPASGSAPLIVSFDASATVDPNGDQLTFSWDFGDGSTGSGATISHTYQEVGQYTATLTVSDGELSSQGTTLISVESNECQSVLVNTNDFEDGWGIWVDGGIDARRNASDAPYANSGIYSIRLRDNTNTSNITTENLNLSAFEEITVDLTFIAVSMDNPTEDLWLQISTDGGASFETVKDWNKDEHFVNDVRVFDQVVIPGPFTTNTKLRFQLDASGDNDLVYLDDITISGCSNVGGQNQAPSAQFTASSLIGIAPMLVNFNANASSDPDNDPLTYSWNFGDGTTGTGVAPSHTYQSVGTFTVVLTVSDGQASTQAVVTIFTSAGNEAPVASFTATPTTGDAPLLVSFDASASADADNDPLTYSWNFGDGSSGTGVTAGHTYLTGGIYTATLTVSDGQAASQSTKTITVIAPNQGPTASFTANPTSGVAPLLVNFNGTGSSDPENDVLTYNWTFGDGGTASGATPSHTYGVGSFTATLTVSDGEFSSQSTTTIVVSAPNQAPTASFTANPTSGAAPLLVSFNASASSDPENNPLTYSWNFGDGSNGTGLTPSHTYTNGGVFTVTLTVSDGQSSDQATTTITSIAPNQGPTASFTANPTSGVAPLLVNFNGTGSTDPENDVLTYNWTFGDGGTASGATPSHTYGVGSFTVTLTVSDGEFSSQSTTTIVVSAPNQAPTASFTANPTTGTAPLLVNFNASGSSDPENSPLTYSWNFGDGSNGTGLTPSHTYTNEGVYTVVLTVSDGQAAATATATITVENGGCTIVEVNAEDFEQSWGIWNDGGTDARRNANDDAFANSGIYTIRLRDKGTTAHMTTNSLNLSTFEEITVDFSYIANSMDNVTEDFWLQISTDGGSTFTTVAEYRPSIEFENNIRESGHVVIPGPFTATTQFRFQCDAGNDFDWVYIDDVVISGCSNPGSALIASQEGNLHTAPIAVSLDLEKETEIESLNTLDDVIVFPNPTLDELNIKYLPADTRIQLFDLNGKMLLNKAYTDKLDLSNYSKGVYILSLKTEKAVRRIKVVKE